MARKKQQVSDIDLPPLTNGLDYMESAVEHLAGQPTTLDLKYAILHLSAAIEVLLKSRLEKEHWSLVFKSADQASLEALESGDFESVTVGQAVERLRKISAVEISKADELRVTRITKRRNRLQHHGLTDVSQAVQSDAASALDFLLSFIDREMRDGDDGDEIEDSLTAIRDSLTDIKKLTTVRMQSLRDRFEALDLVLTCPNCSQEALVPGEPCRCLFCTIDFDPEEAADQYISEVLGISRYRAAKDGETYPLHECVSCERETMVAGVRNNVEIKNFDPHSDAPVYWACFAEGLGWPYFEVSECSRCGVPTTMGTDDGSPICGSCTEHWFSDN